MKLTRLLPIALAGIFAAVGSTASAQSYFDDDIYYDASKATKKTPQQTIRHTYSTPSTVVVAEYPAADTYTGGTSRVRSISVDDYNRRGIFATDSLSVDSTANDFAYTRRIEQFYNPEIVSGSGDSDLANIYYMEPEQVNIYVNTPSAYWGYDYFYPSFGYYTPYWNFNWRWGSPWYWNSWYDPYWAWGPSWGWGWGPGWGWGWNWGPSYGWGWGLPSWSAPRYNPRHQGARPGNIASRPGNVGNGNRPGVGPSPTPSGNRHNGSSTYPGYRPGNSTTVNGRPSGSVNAYRNSSVNSNRTPSINRTPSTQPSRNPSSSYTPSGNSNGGRTYNFNSGTSSSRSSGSWGGSSGGSSGGSRSSGGGRGRH